MLIVVLSYNLFAEVWAFEDFEGGVLDGTTLYDLDGDANNWEITDSLAYSGTYAAKSVSAGLTPDNFIISPQIYVEKYSATNYPILNIKFAAEDPINYAEHFELLISFTDTDTASFVKIYEETLTSSDWKEVEINLQPFFPAAWTANVYIAIRHFNSDGQSALLFDEFMLYNYTDFLYDPPSAIFSEGVIAPYENIFTQWDSYDASTYDASWNFIGFGDIKVHYILSDGVTQQPEETIVLTRNTDPLWDWLYYGTIPGQPMGTFIEYWCETIDNTPQGIITESQHFFAEWGEVNFDEGFEEGGELPEGWSSFTTGVYPLSNWDYPWTVSNTSSNAHSGSYSITSAAQNNFGVYETEDFLVSPIWGVNGASKLKYYINQQCPEGFTDKYEIFVSTVGGDSASIVNSSDTLFVETLVAGPDDTAWIERVVDLSSYDGQFIWIAFKHRFTQEYKLDRYLNIDDVSISELPLVIIHDAVGNATLPNEPFEVTITATDYSGILSANLYYTIGGGDEVEVNMNDNGDDTFTGEIPEQILNTRGSWYVKVTDNSVYLNTTTTEEFDAIWFEEKWIEWGTVYTDEPYGNGIPWIAAMDWNFGTKESLYLNKIEAGFEDNETVSWKLVEFDGVPTNNVIGTLEGTADFKAGVSVLNVPTNDTRISGHVAIALEINGGFLYLDEGGDLSHSWEYTASQGWQNNDYGMFHLRMFVSNDPTGINEGEFIANTTQLCQNYPNPFNPATSIRFFNKETGKVNLAVYNVAGEKVASLVNGNLEQGYHKIKFDATKLNSGVYYYTLVTPEARITKKMILVK